MPGPTTADLAALKPMADRTMVPLGCSPWPSPASPIGSGCYDQMPRQPFFRNVVDRPRVGGLITTRADRRVPHARA